MCGPGSLNDLKELLEPIRDYFDGIVATYHGSINDDEANYLENIKKDGKILYLPYSKRHHHSRNTYLWCGPIKQNDWICTSDVLEHPNSSFCADLKNFIPNLDKSGINMVYYYGKPFLFKYHDSLEYYGSPHEGLQRKDGKSVAIELSKSFPDEKDIRLNVRPLKRTDSYQWMHHYLKYYIFPWGSNHCLLGNENRGHPYEIYQKRESLRIEFLEYLISQNVELNNESVIKFLTENYNNPIIKKVINEEKIINDIYRFYVLNDKSVNDNHHWKDMISI